MNIKHLIGAVSVLALVGCASNSSVTKQEIAVQESIDNLPEWYVDLPKADEGDDVLYVAGTGKSEMLMLAKDKAILDVEKPVSYTHLTLPTILLV